ncbi:hypothetical protein BUALT_Bualt07G0018300 [Buddleja alternifolia]|uniref:NB-ARC domain-containing protein n=1 Tax=Buddleja alternifolia TaxID=168488 RepID=A0AAV6XE58_9LAMI|nr:hypothetical protein BUALT_Bualt07G0018300 [Buddleja alternifolia]
MVGRDEDIAQLKVQLMGPSRLQVIPIVGVCGIGKTALAEKVFKDSFIMDCFETHVWIKLSHKYCNRDVLIGLLCSMKKLSDKKTIKTDDQLAKYLYNSLKSRRYLIVLDAINNADDWNDLRALFPNYNNGSRIMLTTKDMDVVRFGNIPHQVTFLSEHESWCLLRNIVFDGWDTLQIKLDFKLFRVLDALNIRFYCFPIEIPKLVQLRYFVLSYNEELPASVCKLQDLQFLIVLRYLNIKRGAPLYPPMEIWNMKELRHLQVMGSDLPDPSTATGVKDYCGQYTHLLLENLSTLLDVSAHICTPRVVKAITNLKKLGIQIEPMLVENIVQTFSFLSHLFILQHLESLKCIVTHPYFASKLVPFILWALPESLTKLTLSGCGFPWKYMSVIGSLMNLEVLNLKCYAFCDPIWESREGEFLRLKYLRLEDMDIEYWRADETHFPCLTCLIITHSYKMREIPSGIRDIATLDMIEVVDCSPLESVLSTQHIKQEQRDMRNAVLGVQVHYSWDG